MGLYNEDKKEKALKVFSQKFNCAQSVFSVFAEDLGIDEKTALKIAGCFGGGVRCGEVCGAVSGALMAIGLKYGHCMPNDLEKKEIANLKAFEMISKFKSENGSIICRNLLGYDLSIKEELDIILEKNLYATVCPEMISSAVQICDKILNCEE